MRAIVQRAYGDAGVLHLDEIPRPTIKPREVLVEMRAAGLDRGTWHLMTGLPYVARAVQGFRAPRNPVPGLGLAGVVVAVGRDVTRFRPGDEVYGVGRGSFAEFTAAREERISPKPVNLGFAEAAAVPVSAVAALRGLCDVGGLRDGQNVLITGASGGVGTFAVQIAKAFGATVTAECGAAKADLVRNIGADRVVGYEHEDFAADGSRYDLIFDIAGHAPLSRLRGVLAPGGTLVLAGGEGGGRLFGVVGRLMRGRALSPFTSGRVTALISREDSEVLDRLTRLIEKGRVRPVVERTYALADAADAMRRLAAGHVRGKVVIAP